MEVLLAVRLVHAAPCAGLGIQHQLCAAGELEVQRELFVGAVLGVHDAEQVLPAPLAQPCVHALGTAFACHPLKAVRVVLAVIQSRLGGVGAAKGGKVFLEGVVEGVFQQIPVQLPLFVPLPEMCQLVAHKVQLFAGMGVHIKI